MLGLDRRTARYTWTVVFILLLLGVVYLIRETLLIFGVSLLFAYLLWPLVKFLDRRLPGRSQVWALAIVYLSLVTLFIVAGMSIGSRIVAQANALATKIPEFISQIDQPAQPVASSARTVRSCIYRAPRGPTLLQSPISTAWRQSSENRSSRRCSSPRR